MKTQTNRNGSITSTMTTTTTTLLNLKTDHHNCPLASLSLFSFLERNKVNHCGLCCYIFFCYCARIANKLPRFFILTKNKDDDESIGNTFYPPPLFKSLNRFNRFCFVFVLNDLEDLCVCVCVLSSCRASSINVA